MSIILSQAEIDQLLDRVELINADHEITSEIEKKYLIKTLKKQSKYKNINPGNIHGNNITEVPNNIYNDIDGSTHFMSDQNQKFYKGFYGANFRFEQVLNELLNLKRDYDELYKRSFKKDSDLDDELTILTPDGYITFKKNKDLTEKEKLPIYDIIKDTTKISESENNINISNLIKK